MAQRTQLKNLIEVGVSQIQENYHLLQDAVVALAQESARTRLDAANITALTDNSTGTPAASLVAVPIGVLAENPASAPTKASFDTQMALVRDAHLELSTKINAAIAVVAGASARVVRNTNGTAVDGTIAAIAAFTNGTDDTVDFATGNAQIVVARNNQAAICAGLNYLRTALGVAPVTDGSGGVFNTSATEYVTVNPAATGAAADDAGDDTMTAASALAALNALKNNLATLAARTNEILGTLAIGPFVVATQNPRTRFKAADVTL